MTAKSRDAEPLGARHLRAIAARPRGAGTPDEAHARAYAAGVLTRAGFTVREEQFSYSEFPGRYGTPIAGAMIAATVAIAAMVALSDGGGAAVSIMAAGLVAAFAFARLMLGDGVLRFPLLRATGTNLVATRGSDEPRAWLVAHLDSKSQPIPTAGRVAGIVILAVGAILGLGACLLTLADLPARTVWWVALATSVAGSIPVMASIVGNDSPGAVDNASGVAAVLVAAGRVSADVTCGVLVPSAEELGMAGARAWAKGRKPGIALNCDGVDDTGALVIMHSGRPQTELVNALQQQAPSAVVRRMPPGLLTDSVALEDNGWKAVTVSHGNAATLRRIHTRGDSLERVQGSNIEMVAEILAFTLEVIAVWA